MLKRYQVLLNGWLGDHLKAIAEKHDLSFSEVIRLGLCLMAGECISKTYPQYKFPDLKAKLHEFNRERDKKSKVNPEEFHRFLSKVYFETRKAIEFWETEEKKKKA